ncbi:peptide methionine sulfoxide reductase [Agrilactobacillus composti DSM 18527 = JCM 14202]|uniref:Peptide methionine sulfoxide reductase MsrA n=1 Tax=Agrilactobacillus composti DSM 18527 = JCM 14202 TaxID=1423734 RepID=X0PHC9_9LACO|nr:peptide-methionine (S)-S-oxide reductase MsrA [Agrilactobacillus composti]KRM32996.1 peptide methionine sulfoxide reductase [Agrilactobacillus composti DSM 18527 = JCM 14202]GAF41494.1 peptide methionine sulfoxide reductase MsrA [Agrilactobacillus composti DSM 18527 = JCM 14202]
MIDKTEQVLTEIYNLMLNPATRDWERQLLTAAKTAIEAGGNFDVEIDKLEYDLRPLALRHNLTPDVTDFYVGLTDATYTAPQFDVTQHQQADLPYQERAIFAGGCFWCMVEPFETYPGIVSVLSGYTGGHTDNPTYEQVVLQYTGHVEAIEVIFDTRRVSYQQLVDLYWDLTDPTDELGQISDRGNNYRPVIFVSNDTQRQIATASKQKLAASGRYQKPIVTAIEPASHFWPAENFHQQFYQKNPQRYKRIKRARQQYLAFQRLENGVRRGVRRIVGK